MEDESFPDLDEDNQEDINRVTELAEKVFRAKNELIHRAIWYIVSEALNNDEKLELAKIVEDLRKSGIGIKTDVRIIQIKLPIDKVH